MYVFKENRSIGNPYPAQAFNLGEFLFMNEYRTGLQIAVERSLGLQYIP